MTDPIYLFNSKKTENRHLPFYQYSSINVTYELTTASIELISDIMSSNQVDQSTATNVPASINSSIKPNCQ